MTHLVGFLLVGWVLISVFATPLIGRFLGSALTETDDSEKTDGASTPSWHQEAADL